MFRKNMWDQEFPESMESIDILHEREKTYFVPSTSFTRCPKRQNTILFAMEFSQFLCVKRSAFYYALHYFDAYQSTCPLSMAASLLIAYKFDSMPEYDECANLVQEMCRAWKIQRPDLLHMERLLLRKLQWALRVATPLDFMRSTVHLIAIASKDWIELGQDLLYMCQQWLDVCCLDESYLHYAPSAIAASCLYTGVDFVFPTGSKGNMQLSAWIEIACGVERNDLPFLLKWIESIRDSLQSQQILGYKQDISYPTPYSKQGNNQLPLFQQYTLDFDVSGIEQDDEYQRHYKYMNVVLDASRETITKTILGKRQRNEEYVLPNNKMLKAS